MGSAVLLGIGGTLVVGISLWLVGRRGRLVRESSRRFWQESRRLPSAALRTLHFYIYGRWTREYLIVAAAIVTHLGRRGKQWMADRYHGKVLTHPEATALVRIGKSIPLRDLEQIVPFPVARQFVLQTPLDIAVLECPCRRARAHHCEPTQVCLVIGQPFVDFVLEHRPADCRRITPDEAVQLLAAEHARGHVHAAWFKDACLDRFFAICNCCKCCCGGIQAMVAYGIPMMASSGYIAQIDESRCLVCGRCRDACPFRAVQLERVAVVHRESCLGCGVCVDQCRRGAISLVRDPDKGIPLDVRLMDAPETDSSVVYVGGDVHACGNS